jgi:TPP-dependent pyruvate/acetoin dehydrogenase alpha subunit
MFREKQRVINITKTDLIKFESEVASNFENGKIRGAVHLSNNNEDELINIFQYINKNDWVLSTWRNHYHALLHGVPAPQLMNEILNARSISFQSPEHNFYTSAIVNGIIPVAVGMAYALKLNKKSKMVWCFVGDMAAESGVFFEGLKFSVRNNLPIHFVIEDNKLSTNVYTDDAWGKEGIDIVTPKYKDLIFKKYVTYYEYERKKYPHVGIGKFINF